MNQDNHTGEAFGNVSAGGEESLPDEDEEPVTSGVSPLSSESKSQKSPLSDMASPGCSPGHPEAMQTDCQKPPPNGIAAESEEPLESPNPNPEITPETENGAPLPLSPVVIVDRSCGQMSNGTSPPPSPRGTRSNKRKREDFSTDSPQSVDNAVHNRYTHHRLCLENGVKAAYSCPDALLARWNPIWTWMCPAAVLHNRLSPAKPTQQAHS